MRSTVVAAAEATALACELAKVVDAARVIGITWLAYSERNAIAFIPWFPWEQAKLLVTC
jgi:hypothetical protein